MSIPSICTFFPVAQCNDGNECNLANQIFRQAKTLQSGLLALLDRVDKVREEHDKLEGENRFLQEYDRCRIPPFLLGSTYN